MSGLLNAGVLVLACAGTAVAALLLIVRLFRLR